MSSAFERIEVKDQPTTVVIGKVDLTLDEFEGLVATERHNLSIFHEGTVDSFRSVENSIFQDGKPHARIFRPFRSYTREPFSKITQAEGGGINLINGNSTKVNRPLRMTRPQTDSDDKAQIGAPDISFKELGLKKVPAGIQFGVNGHLPLAEVGNGAILRLIRITEKPEPVSEKVQELRKIADLEVSEDVSSSQGYDKVQGHTRKRRDHHYSAADKENWTNGIDRRERKTKGGSMRQTLKIETLEEYQRALELPDTPEDWESHLQIKTRIIDWSLFPKEEIDQISFTEAELEELGKGFNAPDLSNKRLVRGE